MASLPPGEAWWPTDLAGIPRLLAYVQALGLERHLFRRKRGIPSLVLVVVWLVLAWRRTGRPHHVDLLVEPFLAAVLGRPRLPSATTLYRSLRYFSAHAVRASVEAAYLAELPHRAGRVWVALDSHQAPYWGRGKLDRFQKGWSGTHSRRLRGYRVYLAVDTSTGQAITFLLLRGRTRDQRIGALLARRLRQLLGPKLAGIVADCGFTSHASLAALLATGVPFILGFARSRPIRARLVGLGPHHQRWLNQGGAVRLGVCPWDERLRLFALGARSPTDRRGPWVYVTSLRSAGPQWLAHTYRQRWRVEQAIEELLNGHDLDHLVGYRLHPNQVALGFRLLARNLALGCQIAEVGGRPVHLLEPRAFRAAQVDGLGIFWVVRRTIHLHSLQPGSPQRRFRLPWTRRVVQLAA